MKKMIIAALLATLILNACTEDKPKTVEYYKAHIEEAKATFKKCKNEALAAMTMKDEEAFKKVNEDKECIAAKKGIKQYKREHSKSVNWENMPN